MACEPHLAWNDYPITVRVADCAAARPDGDCEGLLAPPAAPLGRFRRLDDAIAWADAWIAYEVSGERDDPPVAPDVTLARSPAPAWSRHERWYEMGLSEAEIDARFIERARTSDLSAFYAGTELANVLAQFADGPRVALVPGGEPLVEHEAGKYLRLAERHGLLTAAERRRFEDMPPDRPAIASLVLERVRVQARSMSITVDDFITWRRPVADDG